MALTTTKSKKTRWAAIAVTLVKRTRRAGNKKTALANSGQGTLLKAEDAIAQKLDALMKSMADLSGNMQDLSGHVEVTEEWQKEVDVSP